MVSFRSEMRAMDSERIAKCEAWMASHGIASALEAAISAVLGREGDAEDADLVLALADELEGAAGSQDGAAPPPIPAHRVSAAQARIVSADLERVVGEAVSGIVAHMPPKPLEALARNLRNASKGAGSNAAVAETRRWSRLVEQGWAKAAALSQGREGSGSGGEGHELELLRKVSRQVDALRGLEDALSSLGLLVCQRRMHSLCAELGIRSAQLKAVPPHYYSLTFEQRRDLLEAPSTFHLCKTIVLQNTAWDAGLLGGGASSDGSEEFPTNAQFYAVIVQYEAKLHADKVLRLVRSWTDGAPKSKFNFQLCPEHVSARLTGYKHNAVAPIGCTTPIPLILSHRIAELQPCFMWLGGAICYGVSRWGEWCNDTSGIVVRANSGARETLLRKEARGVRRKRV